MKATELKNKKITMATLKSFIKKSENLFVEVKSSFDGMVDCVMPVKAAMRPVSKEDAIGYSGVWCVGNSRDYLTFAETDTHFGITVSNCCGCGTLWTKK